MSNRCKITGKRKMFGNRVSHAKNRTKHCFLPNVQVKRIFVPELDKWVKVKLACSTLRTVDKYGLLNTLKKYGMTLEQVTA